MAGWLDGWVVLEDSTAEWVVGGIALCSGLVDWFDVERLGRRRAPGLGRLRSGEQWMSPPGGEKGWGGGRNYYGGGWMEGVDCHG
jgi:hypothetical protein